MNVNKITNIMNKKSIMYKIISLGFPVYTGDEEDEFVITTLLCSKCNEIWQMSRSECMFCGYENPHIYECSICNNKYSITRTSKKCCGENLIKRCINPDCITNTDKEIREYFDEFGGVFEISKSGATLNEMRCKKCGSKINEYKSVVVKLVTNIKHIEKQNTNICYIQKNSEDDFIVLFKNRQERFQTIEDILKQILSIKSL